jgi:hypothetical protein
MRKFEGIKIFFIALITGNIMGAVLFQIFESLTIETIIIMEIFLTFIIIVLYISSKIWNKRQNKMKKFDKETVK